MGSDRTSPSRELRRHSRHAPSKEGLSEFKPGGVYGHYPARVEPHHGAQDLE